MSPVDVSNGLQPHDVPVSEQGEIRIYDAVAVVWAAVQADSERMELEERLIRL